MVERRELITICRQIGTMMEVGVDFLRLTRSLREQTENPRLLELYDQIEHDMRMGENMADAIAKAPDVFSPFAVSLIRQGEARGDIEGAWHRLADFLKQEAQQDKDLGLDEPLLSESAQPASTGRAMGAASRTLSAPGEWQNELRRVFALGAAYLATISLIWAGVEADWVAARALVPLQLLLGAGFLSAAAWKKRPARVKSAKVAGDCSFCGRSESEAGVLTRSSLLAGAAICASCARAFGESETLSDEAKKRSAQQLEMARDFAVDFPARFSDRATNEPTPGVAPEFEIGASDGDEDGGTPHQEKRFEL